MEDPLLTDTPQRLSGPPKPGLIIVGALMFVGGPISIVVGAAQMYLSARQIVAKYEQSPGCTPKSPTSGLTPCSTMSMTVAGAYSVPDSKRTDYHLKLTSPSTPSLDVIVTFELSQAAGVGSTVAVKSWRGKVMTVTYAGLTSNAAANPYNDLRSSGGLFVMGLVLLPFGLFMVGSEFLKYRRNVNPAAAPRLSSFSAIRLGSYNATRRGNVLRLEQRKTTSLPALMLPAITLPMAIGLVIVCVNAFKKTPPTTAGVVIATLMIAALLVPALLVIARVIRSLVRQVVLEIDGDRQVVTINGNAIAAFDDIAGVEIAGTKPGRYSRLTLRLRNVDGKSYSLDSADVDDPEFLRPLAAAIADVVGRQVVEIPYETRVVFAPRR